MVQQLSSIGFILIRIFLVLFNKAECKSSGGHYSSQRTLNSGPSGGHGFSSVNQLQNPMYWSSSWFPSDLDSFHDNRINNFIVRKSKES
ncbi:unnamed protein product [Rotaria sp. Silwood1]|nr:unnamed protein product [Rotaria sp. Silwood1]CAF1164659.1 unnamed protein product [Rotaria sp. Silwood1]CAF3331746.1 unnamed protein product [Rotaria sp. Silwood1]CAF3351923.1 unnamed protein product [Rotaria sp. Silwood1]CAF3356487.1 unnamed protein product [Rotaria sp. Silwood1]